jgi:hypothetical protein
VALDETAARAHSGLHPPVKMSDDPTSVRLKSVDGHFPSTLMYGDRETDPAGPLNAIADIKDGNNGEMRRATHHPVERKYLYICNQIDSDRTAGGFLKGFASSIPCLHLLRS